MELKRLQINDVVEIKPKRHGDSRGYFSETFRQDWFAKNVEDVSFVQENQSLTAAPGTVRGLHFQTLPYAQGKLVRCTHGAIFDVAVDIRAGSPTYGGWVSAVLDADQGNQLWIPAGFLHGFCTLTENAVVSYKVTSYYNAEADKGVRWDDPDIGIIWPDLADGSRLSAKDAAQPALKDIPAYFIYPSEKG
ncbi:dTDP-4-dehydrorhamnose 3,5-epimerase [Rhizobium sp. AG855]|uniref:dTDP-4-dehydrorhamnose 3,5-epimerase n=1 Tax=Rhizobium sp. AG855 TaxID=2183898 RepID=UPI000E748193|nr:dTDP-4-dehydrorhamnose 3,5-epimerase [Rhizobium sp. AG855]RKE85560.1 dTDP-4-dehydrorhamnose 3,5-epimerase [Rhizobium sp. AG855]